MSAEFMTEYTDNAATIAIETIEQKIQYVGNTSDYLIAIQERYAETPNGLAELNRLVRAAQLIEYTQPRDTGERVQAVYHGELLGMELINHLKPGDGSQFKSGFAQTFTKHHLDRSRLKNSETVESHNEMVARFIGLSKELQDMFQLEEDIGLNPLYEAFGQKLTSDITDSEVTQKLAMIGFRMIVREALSPSIATYQMPLKTYEHIESITPKLTQPEFEQEDISYVRQALLDRYFLMETTNERTQRPAHMTDRAVEAYKENLLRKFNTLHTLLEEGDVISFRGNQFVLLQDGSEEMPMHLLTADTEVQGIFDSINLVEAPTQRQLRQSKQNILNEQDETTQLVPAIRLVHPRYIVSSKDNPYTDTTAASMIDIPLHYKNVKLSRIGLQELERDT